MQHTVSQAQRVRGISFVDEAISKLGSDSERADARFLLLYERPVSKTRQHGKPQSLTHS